jgi:hypothetical protein
MNFSLAEEPGLSFVEGQPGAPAMATVRDCDRLLEVCLAERAYAALLYPANLTPAFFDLSSGEAGEILQKLRNYRIRLALVCPPGSVKYSSRFGEMVADEARGAHFGVFETRQAAIDWLRQHA